MESRSLFATLAVSAALWVGATAAHASVIVDNFSFTGTNNTVLASGSFSYDSSHSGILSYADLNSFTVSLDGSTYGLSFVNSLASSAYIYFGYDTTNNTFAPGSIAGADGNYSGILAGTNLSNGFFFDPLVGQSDPAGTGADGEFANYSGDSETVLTATGYSITSVPEPATWALFAVGAGLLGLASLARRRGVSAV